MDKYLILSFIGEGSFGRVFKAKDKENDQVVALKVIRKKGRSSKDLKNLQQECDIQCHLQHPNIIRMIDSFDTPAEMVVVTEFAAAELHSVLGKQGCLPEPKARAITWDLVSALYYLHSHRILHRDLKPQNVLIDSDGHAKLCDFGLARNMTMGTHVLTSIKGTPLYMAPELIDEKPYDHQADLWSLGCIVYELMSGQPPFCTSSIVQLVRMIRNKPIQWPTFLSTDAYSFLQGLLHKDPIERMGWPDILAHPFVSGHVLILPEDKQSDSPFTRPLSQSQMEAKMLQREKFKNPQKVVTQAVQILERREHDIATAAGGALMTAMECVPMSDDDSIRAVSAHSVRDSLRTDDDEPAPMTPARANLLRHQYSLLNDDNLVLCDLEKNMAQLFTQEPYKGDTIPNVIHSRVDERLVAKQSESIVQETKLENEITETNIVKEMKKSNSKDEDMKSDNTSISMESPKTGSKSSSEVNVGLSKSVPLSYKEKILQFSRDKLRFGSGNRLTRSLKKSFHLSRSSDKNKVGTQRRLSEPTNLETSLDATNSSVDSLDNSMENDDKKDAKEVNDVEGEVMREKDTLEEESECCGLEQEEWEAFLNSNMNEVMEGDVESLTQLNVVRMVTGALRSGGGARVCGGVAALLSLPFVAPGVTQDQVEDVQDVYLEAKLVANLIYAVNELMKNYCSDNQAAKPSWSIAAGRLSMDELGAIERVVCLFNALVASNPAFGQQLCVAPHAATVLAGLLSLSQTALRIVLEIVAILIEILQDLPEHAEFVEKVIFSEDSINICDLLKQSSDLLKVRTCVLLGLLSNFCCSALCTAMKFIWCKKQREFLEDLEKSSNSAVSQAAKCAVKELSNMPFYKQNQCKSDSRRSAK